MTIAALIVAAGRGTRAGSSSAGPKQYMPLGGQPMLAMTLKAFLVHPEIGSVQAVIHADDRPLYDAAVQSLGSAAGTRLAAPVIGGATRQASVANGLEALLASAQPPDRVLIHDAARPFVDPDTISRVIDALAVHPVAIAAEPLADTLKRAAANGTVASTLDRTGLWRAQTPQGVRLAEVMALYRRATADGRLDFTDDAAIAEWGGLQVGLVPGHARNSKITTAEDLAMAQGHLAATLEPRIGTGFDVHRFVAGDHVWLCGVKIPHTHTLDGHSDADAPLHALTDAILGAIGDGDIGQHFPPSDEAWRGAASRLFVEDAARRVAARGGRITNVDITILCEAPRIGPHREAMQRAVAGMLGISLDRVGVKATTTETMGFTGRREGLAAMASATVLLPA